MSNFFILFADKPIESDKLKLKEISIDTQLKNYLGKSIDIGYQIEPIADIEKTVENEKVLEFYEATCRFFEALYEICVKCLNTGYKLELLQTYYGQSFKDEVIESFEFPVENFIKRYLRFEFSTLYQIVLQQT